VAAHSRAACQKGNPVKYVCALSGAAFGLVLTACGSKSEPTPPSAALSAATVLDLKDVKTNPMAYEWFDFRPNVKKLILSGAAETEHVAILWYTTTDGGVGLHYHARTESVYVIDGTSTDAKGVYPTETVYFNPPGSGHQVTNATGFFVLAYAAPPDFMNTNLIQEYSPVRIDTAAANLTSTLSFAQKTPGVRVFVAPLDGMGGMSAEIIEVTAAADYAYKGNYLVVLEGSCDIEGAVFGEDMLVVGKAIQPQSYRVKAAMNGSCLAMGVSF
jgi:ChrR Cupin-like domain